MGRDEDADCNKDVELGHCDRGWKECKGSDVGV